jgi:prepilin-type N-terminal cleavage/methylation domain-containing protein
MPRCRPAAGTGWRGGFSLVELLVVVAIIAVLIGLLMPAIQGTRESARRVSCLNNARQIGLAMLGFETANGFYAPANSTGAGAMWPPNNPQEHGMFALLLPYIEQGSLLTTLGYDFNQDWSATINRPAACTIIPVFTCPSAPDGPRQVTTARYPTNTYGWGGGTGPATNDYATIPAVGSQLYTALGLPFPSEPNTSGMLPTNSRTRAAHVRDGLSNTLAVVECGNRPLRYFNDRAMASRSASATSPCNVQRDSAKAGWADNRAVFDLDGASAATGVPNGECYHTDATGRVPAAGTTSGGQCVINCTNWDEPYAFHPRGIGTVFGDGSGRFLAADIDPRTMIALVTRAGGDVPEEF